MATNSTSNSGGVPADLTQIHNDLVVIDQTLQNTAIQTTSTNASIVYLSGQVQQSNQLLTQLIEQQENPAWGLKPAQHYIIIESLLIILIAVMIFGIFARMLKI
jgi:transcriptional antiterminator